MKIQNAIAGLAMLAMVGLVATTAQAGGSCCAGKGAKASASGGAQCTDKAMKAGGGVCTGTASAKMCDMSPAECEKWMREHYKTHGWLGVTMSCEGVQPTITAVADNSPAQKAGFKAGDVLTSINGVSFSAENEAAVSEIMKNGFKIGETVNYTAARGSESVKLSAKLVKVDDAALNQMIATHVADTHKAGDKAENVN